MSFVGDDFCMFENMPTEIILEIARFLSCARDIIAFIKVLKFDKRFPSVRDIKTLSTDRKQLLDIAKSVLIANNSRLESDGTKALPSLAIAGSSAIPGFKLFKDVDMFIVNGKTPDLSILETMASMILRETLNTEYPKNVFVTSYRIPLAGEIQVIKFIEERVLEYFSYEEDDDDDGDSGESVLWDKRFADLPAECKTLENILEDFDIPFSSIGYTEIGKLVYGSNHGSNEYNCSALKKSRTLTLSQNVSVAFSRAERYINVYGFDLDISPLVEFAKRNKLPAPYWALRRQKEARIASKECAGRG